MCVFWYTDKRIPRITDNVFEWELWKNQNRRKKIAVEFLLVMKPILPRKRKIASALFLMENNLLMADVRTYTVCIAGEPWFRIRNTDCFLLGQVFFFFFFHFNPYRHDSRVQQVSTFSRELAESNVASNLTPSSAQITTRMCNDVRALYTRRYALGLDNNRVNSWPVIRFKNRRSTAGFGKWAKSYIQIISRMVK